MADVWPQLVLVVGEVGGSDSASVCESNVLVLEIVGSRYWRMVPLLGCGGLVNHCCGDKHTA